MEILLTAATRGEIQPTCAYLAEKMYYPRNSSINTLITGVGLLNTSYTLTKYIQQYKPQLIIQAGIGGSLHPLYPPGAVVMIREEVIGDMGAQEENGFADVFDLRLADEHAFPFTSKLLVNPHQQLMHRIKLPQVRGVSINEITTGAERLQLFIEKYGAAIESMEGAALHYVCLQETIPFLQIRSVSNFAGERDKTKWQLPEAIEHLNRELIVILHQLLSRD